MAPTDLAPVLVRHDDPDIKRWQDDTRGSVSFKTLIDASAGPTTGLVQGIVYLQKGDRENRHRHDRSETIFVVEGSGKAEIGDRVLDLGAGDTLFVPAGMIHAWSAPDAAMTILFTFPADRLDEVTYAFEDA